MKKINISPLGSSWDEFEKEVFTPEEIAASNLRVALIGEMIKSRKEKNLSQKKLRDKRGKTTGDRALGNRK